MRETFAGGSVFQSKDTQDSCIHVNAPSFIFPFRLRFPLVNFEILAVALMIRAVFLVVLIFCFFLAQFHFDEPDWRKTYYGVYNFFFGARGG